jgi:putative drug exporter of the RND superfamily
MVLMGKVNWYIPRWLERILPHINIEGAEFFRKRDRRRAVEPQPEREPVAASTAG